MMEAMPHRIKGKILQHTEMCNRQCVTALVCVAIHTVETKRTVVTCPVIIIIMHRAYYRVLL